MMTKRTFEIEFSFYHELVDTAVIELDQAVIDAVDDDWRSVLYDLHTPEEIAEHIGWNLCARNVKLSNLDGWADQPDSNARIVKYPTLDDFAVTAREITE